jgi:hypothetical protein
LQTEWPDGKGIGLTVPVIVLSADQKFAQNVLARWLDQDIHRFTLFKRITAIFLEQTERHRFGLLNQDFSCSPVVALSTESK